MKLGLDTLVLVLVLSSLTSVVAMAATPPADPVVTCKGQISRVDSSASWLMRAEPFTVTAPLTKQKGTYTGAANIVFDNAIQFNVNVQAAGNGYDWLYLNLDATDIKSGNFETVGPTERAEYSPKNGVAFPVETALYNSLLVARAKKKLQTPVLNLTGFNLRDLLNDGTVANGDILLFGVESCVVSGR